MLDQELASIMHFVLAAAGRPNPIYHEMPENFCVPAVYFPPPELTTAGDTLLTYSVGFSWYIKAFHYRDDLAHDMAKDVLLAAVAGRRLVPLRGENGEETGGLLRLKDLEVKSLDMSGVGGAAQLTITWDSRRPYNAEEVPKMMDYHLDINGAYETAVKGLRGPKTGL